jgi:hypothetical protein
VITTGSSSPRRRKAGGDHVGGAEAEAETPSRPFGVGGRRSP